MENTLAAQYLRVSTERQEYSLDFQSARIKMYALQHDFTISHTYVDEAKSGLDIRRRKGLSQLLRDVVGGEHPYRAILVYDVSRWGRFQDPDEAAHYEFLCRAAGNQVHYCAEQFSNDSSLANSMMKALKRVMAGEYSRELSEKVFAGLSRVARAGFRTGGRPGYGLRRMLISAARTPKRELAPGELKSVSNERVKLVPGPATELYWIREIYRMFISERRTIQGISDELNCLHIPSFSGREWSREVVQRILTDPKYKGTCIYNRHSSKLRSRQKTNPEAEWIVVPNAFEPIIDPATFEAAQQVFRGKSWNLSNEQALEALTVILKAEGKLSSTLLRGVPNALTKESYRRRFGSLTRAFDLVGYDSPLKSTVKHREQIRAVRREVMENLVRLFAGDVSIQMRGPIRRNYLRLRHGTRVAVRACRCVTNKYKGPTWILQPARSEKRLISLLIGLNAENTAPEFLYVLPPIANRHQVAFSRNCSWFKEGTQLENASLFCDAVRQIRGKHVLGGERRPKGWLSEDARAAVREALRARWEAKNKLSG